MEEKDWNQILADFSATKEAKPNLSEEEWFEKFPEFNNDGNMLQAAFDYDATVKSGKYKDDQATLQSKFPEFWGTSNAAQPQSTPPQATPQAAQQPNEYAQKMAYNPYGNANIPPLIAPQQAMATEDVPEQYRDAYSRMSPAEQRVFSRSLARQQQMSTPEGRSKAAQDMRDWASNMKRKDPRRKQLLERADALDHSEDALRTPDEMRALTKTEEKNEKNKKIVADTEFSTDYTPEYYHTKKEAQRIKDEQYRAIEGRAVAMGKHTDNYAKGSDIYRDATDIFDQTDEGKVYNAKIENSIQLDRDDFAMSMLNSDNEEMKEVAQMYSQFGDIEREGQQLAALNESLKERAKTLDTTNEDAVNAYNKDVKEAQKRYDAYLKQIEEYDKLRKSGALDKYNEAFQEYITESDESATKAVLQEKNDAMTAMFCDWIDRKSIPLKKKISKDFTDEIEKRINDSRSDVDVPNYLLNNPIGSPLGISGRKTESGALTTASQYTKKTQDLISNDNQNLYANSLVKGAADTAGDMDFWTFGLNEAVRGFISMDIMDKVVAGKDQLSEDERRAYDSAVEKGYKNLTPEEEAATEKAAQLGRENLNEDEKLAYDAMQNYWQVQQLFKPSGWYTAGQVTAEALPFIVAMWGSGGIVNAIKGGAKSAEKVALRQAARQAEKMTFKQAAKNVGKAAGNMALEGAVYASTTGLPHTVAGTLEYLMPQSNATYDLEEGGIKVNRLEESEDSILSAAAKSWGTQMIEGMSEAFSTYALEPLEAAAYARIFGRTAEELAKGGNRAYKDIVRAAFKKGSMGDGIFRNISSFPNEYIEELFGGFARCVVGLSEWDQEFSGETLAQTAYGLLPMQVVFSAMGGGNLRKHRQRMRQAEQFLDEFSPDSKALYDRLSGMSTYEGQDLLDREILSIQQEVDALKQADKFTPEMQQKMAARMNMALVMKEQLYMDEAAATIKEEQKRNAYEAATSNLNEQNGNLVYAEYKDKEGNTKQGYVISQDGENTIISDGKKRFKVKSSDVTVTDEYTMEDIEDTIIGGEVESEDSAIANDIANPVAGQDYYDHMDDTPLVLEGGGMLHVDEVDDDGNVTFTLNGRQATVSRRQFREIVQQSRNNMEYAEADTQAFNKIGKGIQSVAVRSEDPMLNAQLGRRGRDARAYLAEAVGEERVRQMEQMDGKELARAYAEADATTKKLMQNWMELGGYDMGRTYEEAINERVDDAAKQQYKRFEEFALRQDEQTASNFQTRGSITDAILDDGTEVVVGRNDGNEAVVMDMAGNMQIVHPSRLSEMRNPFAMGLARHVTQGVAKQMQALQTAYNGTAFQADTEHTIAVSDEGVEDKAVIVGFGNNGSVAYATEYSPNKEGGYNIANRSVKEVSADEFRDMVEGAQRKAAMQQARKAEESKSVADQGVVKDGQDVTVMVGNKPAVGKYVFNAGHHFVVDAEGKVIGDFKSMDELKASMQEAQAAAKAGEQMAREAELVEQSEMEKEYQRRLDEAKTTEERAAVIQEYLDQIKTEDFTMLTDKNYEAAMRKAGAKEEDIADFRRSLAITRLTGQRVRGFNLVNGGIFIHADDIVSIEDARTTYVHERQHTITRNNVPLQEQILNSATEEELKRYVSILSGGSTFYNDKKVGVVAEEFLSMAMEVAYKTADVEAALRGMGIDNDALIQTIKQLDNEQRTEGHLSDSRRGSLGNEPQRSDNRNDVSDTEREPGQVGEPRPRPARRSGEETGDNGTRLSVTAENPLNNYIAENGSNTANKLANTIASQNDKMASLQSQLAEAMQTLDNMPTPYDEETRQADQRQREAIAKLESDIARLQEAMQPFSEMQGELEAREAYKIGEENAEETTGQESGMLYSITSLADALNANYVKGANGKTIFTDKDGNEITEFTPEMVTNSRVGAFINEAQRLGRISKRQADKQIQFFADFMNTIMNVNDLDLVFATTGAMGFVEMPEGAVGALSDANRNRVSNITAFTNNSDAQYATTIDFTTICVKTQQIINVMSEVMKAKGRGLTPDEITDIVYKATHEAGEPVPCPVCYVFARWVGLGGLLDNIRQLQEEFSDKSVVEIEKEINRLKKQIIAIGKSRNIEVENPNVPFGINSDGREALEKDIKDRMAAINKKYKAKKGQVAPKMTAADKAALRSLQNDMHILDNWAWLTKVRMNPEYETKGKVPNEVLFDINAGKEFADKYPLAWAYRTTRGPAAGKTATPYAPQILGQYVLGTKNGGRESGDGLGDLNVLDKIFGTDGTMPKEGVDVIQKAIARAKAQNLLNGQRWQSTSDARPEYFTDYMLVALEHQLIGSKVQLYTKVPEAVGFFSSIGAETNLSLMPLGRGVDEDGNLIFSNITGMDAEDAFKLSQMFDNVQCILVATNMDVVRAVMKDNRITFFIPYHYSGASEERYGKLMEAVGESVKEGETEDFTPYQMDIAFEETKDGVDENGNPLTKEAIARYKSLRNARMHILTGKVGGKNAKTFSKEEMQLINSNSVLEKLYQRFWVEGVDADCYGVRFNSEQAKGIFPFEYWDYGSRIENADVNGDAFVEYCYSLGIWPRFSGHSKGAAYNERMDISRDTQFGTRDGYWKCLIDRTMYNNDGSSHEQKPIDVTDMSVDFGFRDGKVEFRHPSRSNDNAKTRQIASDVIEQIDRREKGMMYSVSSQIAAKYPNWMDNQTDTETEGNKRGQNTQVATTVGTYKKVGQWIEDNIGKDAKVFDASSGLGLGTLELRKEGFNVDDIEPYPGKGRDEQPTYGGVDAYQQAMDAGEQYDYIISNAVLNVIPDDWRDGVLHDMALLLKPGGQMFINTRKAGEEKTIKNKIELESPQEVLVGTPERITSYQRFFTPQELKEYVESQLGDGYTVEVANKKNSGTSGLAAVVVKKAESPSYSVTAQQDADYMDAVNRGDMETAQRMVMEAAKAAMPNTKVVDENGNPKVVYHQTNWTIYRNRETGQMWDELDWREREQWDDRDDWENYWTEEDFYTFSRKNARTTNELDGFFFAPEYDEYHGYGNRTIAAFVNIENPASQNDYHIDATYNDAGRNERIRMQQEGYDGVINTEDGEVVEYVAFEPNQIKSADPVTYDDQGNVIPLSERFNEGNDDIRYSVREYNPRAGVPKVRGGWTKDKILRYLKQKHSNHGLTNASRLIAEFDSPEELKDHMFYHGSAFGAYDLKPSITMSEREAERIGGGGYGDRYWGISLSKNKKIASNFSGTSRSVRIYPVVLAKNAKVIERPDFSDAYDLEDHIVELWEQGVDAVWIGKGKQGEGEQELCVLNPKAICVIEHPDYYQVYHLGQSDNPLNIADDATIDRIYQTALDYRQRVENRPRYRAHYPIMEDFGVWEEGISEEERNERRQAYDNAMQAYREGKREFENSDEYKEWQKYQRDVDNAISYSFIGRNGAQRLDLKERAMTRMNSLYDARRLEEMLGNTDDAARKIKLATGWERGKDGKWRYEISDEDYAYYPEGLKRFYKENPIDQEMIDLVKKQRSERTEEDNTRLENYIKERDQQIEYYKASQGEITLDDVIDHEELFRAYPQLRGVKVVFTNMEGGKRGQYDSGKNEISISSAMPTGKQRSTLIHEIQHAIQDIEGFAQGGNPSYVAQAVKDMDNNAKIWGYKLSLDEAAAEHPEHADDPDALLNDILDGMTEEEAVKKGWIPEESLRKQAYKIYEGRIKGDSYEKAYKQWYDKLREAGRTNYFEGSPFDLYKRLAGEVEARNTQARLGMTYRERLETLAKETEDVAREDQLIMMAGDPILYSVTANEDTDMGRPTMKEITTEYLWKLAEQQQNDWLARADAVTAFNQLLAETMLEMRNMGKADKLSKKTQGQIIRATEGSARAQERFDKAKAEKVMRMAQMMMRYGNMDSLTRGEVNRLMSAMKNAIEPQGMFEQAQKVIDIMVQHQLRDAAKVFGKQLRTKTSKLNASGVEVQAGLDLQGQHIIKVLRDAIKIKDVAEFNEKLRDAMDGMGSDSKTKSENASLDYAGLLLAKQYIESVRDNAEQEKAIKKDLKDKRAEIYDEDGKLKPEFKGKLDEEHARIKREVQQYEKAANERLRDLRMERIDAYARLSKDIADVISGSRDRAKEWAEREMERAREIQHNANSDLQGIPAREQPRTRKELSFGERVAGSGLTQLLTASTRNFNEYLRFFGDKSPDGRGYLWNRFMPQVTEARDSEWANLQYELSRLNAKVAELTNGKAQDVADLMAMGRKMDTITVSYRDGDEITPHEMTQGEALYIYMVNKMSDGAMKLRSMGITEEDVHDIMLQLDDTFLEFADWVQEDYLPSIRERYNEVHQRMFGAPMANITDYFPLKINSDSREKEEQLGVEFDKDMPSTVTGAIIARKHNNTALNLKSDAMSVLIQHVMEMEHWAAYAELSRDLGTLLSYKRFRNRAKNMSSARLGGAARVNANGKEDKSNIFENFKKTCNIVCGTFSPTSKTDEIDKQVRNIVKGVTAAKINFRLYTAAKQITSAPAFWTKAAPQDIAKNLFPILTKDTDTGELMTTWRWAIENLPGFAKRWQSRQAGNEMLDTTDTDWGIWKNKFVAAASRIGMTPNAFVDAMTVIAGSKAVFDTSFRRYKNAGYSEEEAKKKALLDASVAYNESQQSQDPTYLSIMQANRTFLNSAFSLFRNSSFGYWRNYTRAIHNIKKMSKKGYKEETLEFLTKQAMRDGLTEEQAKKLASKTYNRQWYRSIADVALFGFIIEFAWNIAPYAVYLLGGDDKKKKREMLTDAARHSVFGSIEGMPGGNIASTFINDLLAGRDVSSFSYHLLPILSDIEKIKSEYATDKVAMANDIIGLLLSSFSGVDPRGVSDIVVAIMDACNGDPELSIGAALCIMRIAEVPQSQLDELMIDEIGMTAGEARRLPADQVAKRYANYKLHRNAPLTSWAYDDEAKQKKLTKYENVLLKKAEDRLNSMSDEDAETYFDETDDITVKGKMAKGIYSEYGLDKDYEGAKPTKNDSETTTRKKITYQKMRTLEDVKEDAALRSYMMGLDHESNEYKAVSKDKRELDKVKDFLGDKKDENDKKAMERYRSIRKKIIDKYNIEVK